MVLVVVAASVVPTPLGPGRAQARRPVFLPLSSAHVLPASWARPGPLVRASAAPTGPQMGGLTPFPSPNWSGFTDTGAAADFTGVTGMWTVPTVKPGAPGDSATWVGIDGFDNQDLVQAGTDQSKSGYYAWYELIPQVAFSLGPVKPGDNMYVDINNEWPGTWSVTVEDLTKEVTWSGPVAYHAAGTSAEWVEEAPTEASTNVIEKLADYGTVAFSDMTVSGPGTASATLAPVDLVQPPSNVVVSYPSQYNPGADSFQLTYGRPPPGLGSYRAVPLSVPAGTPATTTTAPTGDSGPGSAHGYWLAGADGGVFAFGDAGFFGSAVGRDGGQRIVGMAATADDEGYWLVSSAGEVFAFGDATSQGSLPALGLRPRAPVVGMAAAPGGGYWLVSADGGVFSFGGAPFEGSCASTGACDAPAVAIVADGGADGYWVLLANATMVPFGQAPAVADKDCQKFAAQAKLTAVAGAPTTTGRGYWVALQDGSTCSEGDAVTSTIWEAYRVTDKKDPAVALIADRESQGAWLALAHGSVDRYGDAPRLPDLNGRQLAAPIVAAAGF